MRTPLLPAVLRRPGYRAKVLGLRPIAYWPLDEGTGTIAYDRSGNGRNGTYTGITWGNQSPVASRDCPLFDGTSDYCAIYTASLRDAFDGSKGSAIGWVKVSGTGIYTDGASRRMLSLRVDGANMVVLGRTGTSPSALQAEYRAGNVLSAVTLPTTTQDWACIAITWDKAADRLRGYLGGAQIGADVSGLGVWAGVLSDTLSCIGAGSTTPTSVWSGLLAHVAVFSRVLSPSEVAMLSRVG